MNYLEKKVERLEEILNAENCPHPQQWVLRTPEYAKSTTWPWDELARGCRLCGAMLPIQKAEETRDKASAPPDPGPEESEI